MSIFFQSHLSNLKVSWAEKIHDLAQIWEFPEENYNLNSQMAMKWHIDSRSMEEVPHCFSRLFIQFQCPRGKKMTIWIWFHIDSF